MIGRVVHIGVTVTNLEKSMDFYENILGLKLTGKMVMKGKEPQFFDFTSDGFGKSKAVYFKDNDGIILELMEYL